MKLSLFSAAFAGFLFCGGCVVSGPSRTTPAKVTPPAKPPQIASKVASPDRPVQELKPRIEVTDSRDDDKDGIADAYENALLKKFVPKIWLHPNENRWPVNVGWFLRRVTMRFSHPKCKDCEILARGKVTVANITNQSHQNTKFKFPNPCAHAGPQNRSDGYTAEPKKSFFLQFTDDNDHKGSDNKQDWVIYGHVYPIPNKRIVIQYWQLYSYNDSLGSSNHEGDWEFSGVVVDGESEVALRVFHYRHGEVRDIDLNKAKWDGNHHVSYSAKGGHGQYPAFVIMSNPDGTNRVPFCAPPQFPQVIADFCYSGVAWDTWSPNFGGIVNVGELDAPLNDCNWIRYSGLWGEIGLAPTVGIAFTSGPQGPGYQKGWNWAR